ncbi:MAG: endonuclease/exonuclease/phosphatase family protein [Planctomycetota bacterium]
MRRRLLFSLILVVWIGLDFNGLMMSVLGTYFYFGWANTSFHTLKIVLVSLLAFGGPFAYGLVFMRRRLRWELEILLALQMAAYLLCTFVRQSDLFATTTVFGTLVSGVAFVAVLRRLRQFADFEVPVLGLFAGVLLYLWAQVLDDGMMVAIRPTAGFLVLLGALFVLAVSGRRIEAPARAERPERTLQFATIGFALLLSIGVALIYNFNLWSAGTPWVRSAIYSGSFGVGTAAGFGAARSRLPRNPLLGAGMLAVGFALYVVLRVPYGVRLGLAAHGAGCFAMALFAYFYLRRFRFSLDRRPGGLPLAGLQIGTLLSLTVLGSFLITGSPRGFWVAYLLGVLGMCVVEVVQPLGEWEPVLRRRALAALGLLVVPAAPALLLTVAEPTSGVEPQQLTVMTTNARYGWTDDYRFEPDPYLGWLEKHPAAIVGMQEVNKGSFYGGFNDVFELYRARMPGRAIYGDANFGFGNALFTGLPVRESRVIAFSRNGMIGRSFIRALLEHRGRAIEVFVAHVSHGAGKNDIRMAQVEELIGYVKRSERPWIVMGDLNSHPNEREIKALKAGSHKVFRTDPDWMSEPTYPSVDPDERLDYIFFSKHFELVEQAILENGGATDHRAVRMTLALVR